MSTRKRTTTSRPSRGASRQGASRPVRAAAVPGTTTMTAAGGEPRGWPASAHASVHATGGEPPLELLAGSHAGLLDVVLELVGAEQVTLREALGAWQREQDRLLNRAWRRPGGLTRPAGL